MAACTNAEDLFLINCINYCKQFNDLPGAESNEQQAIIKIQNVDYSNSCIRESVAGSFFYIIAGVHGLHVVGGIIALFVLLLRTYNSKMKYYSTAPVETAGLYWHFVDLLWIYLFVFFLLVS